MNNANVCFDERYYAFTSNKIVNWFITKSEGKNYKGNYILYSLFLVYFQSFSACNMRILFDVAT